MAIEAEALATEHFLVLCGRIVGNGEAGFDVVYSWDGQIHTSRQEAIASGLQSLGSDDFSIGVIRDGRLASLDWMNEPKDESPETLREIEEQIDWEDPRNTFAVRQEVDALQQGGDETDFEWLRRLQQHFSAVLIHRSALAEDTARAAEGWQPIETAPKDGTEILLGSYPQNYEGKPVPARVTLGYWTQEEDLRVEIGDCGGECRCPEYRFDDPYWMSSDGGFSKENPATHWRPLPAPPALPLDKEAADANR